MSRECALLSIVVPVLDEEHNVARLHSRIAATLEGVRFEIVFVDDGSTDGTPKVLSDLMTVDPRVNVVRLSRNFGHQPALTAGLDYARGDVVAMMDADLQDPPEVLLEMLERWREGADVVYAVRSDRAGATRFKTATARVSYRLLGRMANTDLHGDAGDFRLLDRCALTALLAMRERNRYLRGMTAWVGFTQAAVPYNREARASGETKYPIRKMLRFAFDAIASFSHAPLQAATVIGLCTAAFAFLLLPVEFIWYLAGGNAVPGITSTIIVIAFLGEPSSWRSGSSVSTWGASTTRSRCGRSTSSQSVKGASPTTKPGRSSRLSAALADRTSRPTARRCGDGRSSP